MENSSRRGQESHIVKNSGHDNRTNHHNPVSQGNIYLAIEFLRCMHRFDLGKVREFHDLRQQLKPILPSSVKLTHTSTYNYTGGGGTYLESTRDSRLTSNNTGKYCHNETGIEHARGNSQVKGVGICTWHDTDVSSLADIL